MQLFDFQLDAYDALREAVAEGHRSIILQLPTGGGKTVVAAHLILNARQRDHRCLFVAHRVELIKQPYRKLIEHGVPEEDLGMRVGDEVKRKRLEAPVQIACINSLEPGDFAGFRLIIVDECHRACSRSYLEALAERDPNCIVIGLTATPERLDRRGLAEAGFTKIVVGALPSELVALGRIMEPTIWTVPDALLPNLDEVGIQGGDFEPKGLAKAVEKRELVGSIVDHYAKHGNERRAVAFATSISHSHAIAEMFNNAGIPARHIDGNSGAKLRETTLEDVKHGRLRVVSQCNLWIEGVDEPSLRCAILAKPTASVTVFLQSVGRVVRYFEGQESTVLDHAGNALRHGHPSEDRVYSLTGKSRPVNAASAMKRCPVCMLLVRISEQECPACGTPFEAGSMRRELRYTPQQLRLLDPEGYKQYFWNTLWNKAYTEGHLAGWVHAMYRTRFREAPGVWPLPPRPFVDDSPEARKAKRAHLQMIARVQGKSGAWVEQKMDRIFSA